MKRELWRKMGCEIHKWLTHATTVSRYVRRCWSPRIRLTWLLFGLEKFSYPYPYHPSRLALRLEWHVSSATKCSSVRRCLQFICQLICHTSTCYSALVVRCENTVKMRCHSWHNNKKQQQQNEHIFQQHLHMTWILQGKMSCARIKLRSSEMGLHAPTQTHTHIHIFT